MAFSGKSPQRLLEGVHVVDALADERAFAEQILVNVRDDARVRIDARVAGEQAHEPATAGRSAGSRRRAAAGCRSRRRRGGASGSKTGRLSGWAMRPDHLARRIARQLRVGVERDDVADLRQTRSCRRRSAAKRSCGAAQQRVELRQLAALALVAHPDAFLRVPAPRAVEEEEDVGPMTLRTSG